MSAARTERECRQAWIDSGVTLDEFGDIFHAGPVERVMLRPWEHDLWPDDEPVTVDGVTMTRAQWEMIA